MRKRILRVCKSAKKGISLLQTRGPTASTKKKAKKSGRRCSQRRADNIEEGKQSIEKENSARLKRRKRECRLGAARNRFCGGLNDDGGKGVTKVPCGKVGYLEQDASQDGRTGAP